MSRKNVLLPHQLFSAEDASVNLTSEATNIAYLDNVGLQVILTGNIAGTLNVEVSLDKANWVTVTSQAVVAGQPDSIYFELNQLSAVWVRLDWAASSGTGTLSALIAAKML
jgi:hypothetical protein